MTAASALLPLAIAQLSVASPGSMPLPEAPAVEVWASEDWPADSLAAAAALPRASLAVSTRSNMLRPEVLALATRRRTVIRLAAPLLPAHIEQLRALPRATFVIALPPSPEASLLSQLERLGPQAMRVQVDRLDEARGAFLGKLKNMEVELDLRGRLPEQEELSLFRRLARARRVARLRASDAPEVIAGLRSVGLARIVIEAAEDRVPEPMLAALAQASAPVRVSLSGRAQPSDVRRLGALPGLSLELVLDDPPEVAVHRAEALLQGSARASP